MRKTAKPFVTEYKSRKPPKNAALFDESMVMDELPSRDINADLDDLPSDVGYDARNEEALRKANSVFGGTKSQATVNAGSKAPEMQQRNVLSDLSYKDPLEERLAAAAPVLKRGRKPGSKNKPKGETLAEIPTRTPVETVVAPTIPPVEVRPVARHRPHVGFIKQLKAERSTKPGAKWKLRLKGR